MRGPAEVGGGGDGSSRCSVEVHRSPDRPGWAVVELTGSVDVDDVHDLVDVLFALIVEGAADLVVDAGGLRELDLAAGRVLIRAARFLGEVGGRLVISDPSGVVRPVVDGHLARRHEVEFLPDAPHLG